MVTNMYKIDANGHFRISLRPVVFIMTVTSTYSLGQGLCTLTAVPRSTQPSTLCGRVKWVSVYELS